MKNILIINGHQFYENIAKGELTNLFIDTATEFFTKHSFKVKQTHIEKGYDVQEELEKFKWADCFFVQYPVYWMGTPWIMKKYMDEVFSGGGGSVTYENDGRSRQDPTKRYGSGGLLKGKTHMLSLTYNCPISEFNNTEGFFEGLSVDEANFLVHKTFEFCGTKRLRTYSIHDIFKENLDIVSETKKFLIALEENFIK
jgi:NADPH dehydrogenase (quinone)